MDPIAATDPGNATSICTPTGSGDRYVQSAIQNYQNLYGKAWPYRYP